MILGGERGHHLEGGGSVFGIVYVHNLRVCRVYPSFEEGEGVRYLGVFIVFLLVFFFCVFCVHDFCVCTCTFVLVRP